jgi:cytochrome b
MKTYIWTVPTRLFHWLLALSFAIAFLLGGEEDFLSIHAALGVFIGVLVIFRILQGLTGPRYARFRDFPVSPGSIRFFITNMRQSKALHPGHNPLAALVMLAIFCMALLSAISGMLLFAVSDSGFLGFRLNGAIDPEMLEEFHDVVVHLFLILVGIHLTGILADTLFHRENGTIWSIFTGYKRIQTVPASMNLFSKVFAMVWFGIALLAFFFVLVNQPVPAGKEEETEQVTKTGEDDD